LIGRKEHFPFVICHFSFSILPVMQMRRDSFQMENEKWQMTNGK